ncbi:hypothetical protein AGMMS49992_33950 [Clostridia bacterium]|nr:hypothetical protein AGMMS49992_33950 [Clostridia bacterium]
MKNDQAYLENEYKVYVDVNENRLKDGRLIPVSFVWEDGIRYSIEKVIDVRPAVSLKAGGMGLRYTVRVANKQTTMFLEEDGDVDKWFMEKKHL